MLLGGRRDFRTITNRHLRNSGGVGGKRRPTEFQAGALKKVGGSAERRSTLSDGLGGSAIAAFSDGYVEMSGFRHNRLSR